MKKLVAVALLALAVPAIAAAQYAPQGYSLINPPSYQIQPQQGGGINPNAQVFRPYQAPQPYYTPPPVPVYVAPVPPAHYGEPSAANGLPRTNYVNGYYRADGTYVAPYYRSR